MSKSWRDISRPIIAGVLADNYGKSDTDTRRALRDAYPFGERKYEPYKVWLDEIKRQLLRRKKLSMPDDSPLYKEASDGVH